MSEKQPTKEPRLCKWCGEPIPYPKGDYCSGNCAKQARLARKKQRGRRSSRKGN